MVLNVKDFLKHLGINLRNEEVYKKNFKILKEKLKRTLEGRKASHAQR